MHGSIFLQLQHYVTAYHGASAWPEVMWTAGVSERTYLQSEAYPDAEAFAKFDAEEGLYRLTLPNAAVDAAKAACRVAMDSASSVVTP